MDFATIQQIYLDKITPKTGLRWAITAFIFVLYVLRIVSTNAFYLITYCVGIYLIHGTILFLTPKGDHIADPFENYDNEDDEYEPQLIDNQFKPIVRNMPEFEFWMFTTKTVGIALVATCFGILDIPVYTPILVIYFCFMFIFTLRCLYYHVKKYKYNPFFTTKDYYKD